MNAALAQLLEEFRSYAQTEREKGGYFERFAVAFIKNDPGMRQEYEDAWLYSEWATRNGLNAKDTGIDAVAKIKGEDSFCAIQCKFYQTGHRIQRADLDSFFTASGVRKFSRRLIIDTTDAPWGTNAEAALEDQDKPASRIGLDRLSDSPIDWSAYLLRDEIRLAPKKEIRPHQQEALEAVRNGLAEADRGKLIMACGTGKTFTGLKIAEDLAGTGKTVLFLVPSLALMSQTIREWTIDAALPLRAFAVCSDVQVGKRRRSNSDVAEIETHDLDYPATTDAAKLAQRAAQPAPDRMTVVFSTYQSIQVISDAQNRHGLGAFDLIICDEAHRTTGATLDGEEESNFVKIHNQDFITGAKRLYMTATPRVFGDAVKSKANEASAVLCSMDDETLYGKTLFTRGFGWAVENKLLTDYKVLVLAVDETLVSSGVQRRLADGTSELKLDDATKIIGCYKALTKHGLHGDLPTDTQPMKRALAFCKDIATSKLIQQEFAQVVAEYLESDEGKATTADDETLECQLEHVDGTFNAKDRNRLLEWLKEDHGGNACRILTNARCLSEGVDVPALDAILFMHPRKSQIDVVQSVGRVMRRAADKKLGYVILPVGVPAGVTPEEALNDNDRYRVVWQILNALRSHDERFDAMINKVDLGVDVSDHIEVVAVVKDLPEAAEKGTGKADVGGKPSSDSDDDRGDDRPQDTGPAQASFVFDEISRAIMAKIVKKCGRRDYWEDWATDIAKIAQTHITRITALVEKHDTPERKAFDAFLAEIRDDLNDSVTPAEAVEMLAQHIITRPVFDALFEGYSFAQSNPVSVAMQRVLAALDEHNLDKESASLEKFYDSVRRRAAGIDKAEAKQKIIVELYDKFFRNAFPKMTERLGIVYTPVEIVDFIIHSVNEVLQSEFGQTLGSKGVHIIDPFVGTGTFITRLLQSGLIRREEMEHKYRHEIHANEMVLLAYYIAAINIEAVYHGIMGGEYVPFDGICLTDTFQLYEQEKDLVSELMADNSSRRTRQKELDIRVIVGNPPYSVGQDSANDASSNISYPKLDSRIEETFAARSKMTSVRTLYDSYIRAIRWASDRIGDHGVIGFVTNAGFVDSRSADGLRQCISEEFKDIYIFHLRGRRGKQTAGEKAKQEGGQVFGTGSGAAIAITILVKNKTKGMSSINFCDIGSYLNRDQKIGIISSLRSISGIRDAKKWTSINQDKYGDWLNQRDSNFDNFIAIGDKKGQGPAIFESFSLGVATARDAWCFNSSKRVLSDNVIRMISNYNSERERFNRFYGGEIKKEREKHIDGFIDLNPQNISWTRALKQSLAKDHEIDFDVSSVSNSLYRPFTSQWMYFNQNLNDMLYKSKSIFPSSNVNNLAICVSGSGDKVGFSSLLAHAVPSLHMIDIEGSQCFPRYLYEETERRADDERQREMFDTRTSRSGTSYTCRDAITDRGLAHFQAAYPGEPITKDDVFYYVYGLLHSEEYRKRYADNLSKQLPRIPAVKPYANFRAFVEAGRALGALHVDYESVAPYPLTFTRGDVGLAPPADPQSFYRVEQMKFAGKRPKLDKTTVIYNANITVTGIPLEAYDYVVNGKSAIDWVMERQCVKTDKASGIVNDANLYAIETVGDPAYPLKLLQRVITVSLETMKIVRALPPLGDLS